MCEFDDNKKVLEKFMNKVDEKTPVLPAVIKTVASTELDNEIKKELDTPDPESKDEK